MINLGNKKVSKLLVGSNVIYQDSDGWIPLELPDGVTGQVFFKDNGDGTAKLAGAINAKIMHYNIGTPIPTLIFNLPLGYEIVSLNWNKGGTVWPQSLFMIEGDITSQDPVTSIATISFVEGSLYAVNQGKYSDTVTIFFSKSTTMTQTVSAEPAVINIKRS